MTSDGSDILRVAIAGAGIAGLTAAIALSKHPRIDVQIYEQANELRQIGASIALGPNGLRTLEKLGIENALSDDVAFRGPSRLPMIYRHWKTNEVVSSDAFQAVTDHRHETARFLRAHLQEALLEHVPKERIHLKKKIASAQADAEKGVTIEFEDGTSVSADLLVGADGIHSKVREAFVPDHNLSWTGGVFYRSIFDASLTEGIPDLPEDSIHWWGPNQNFFASPLGKGKYTTVCSYTLVPEDANAQRLIKTTKWDDPASIEFLRDLYKDWNPLTRALLSVTPTTNIYHNFTGAPLQHYTFASRVALVGDAAHTHGGAYAAGGSLAIDDAYALALAVLHVFPVPSASSSAFSSASSSASPSASASASAPVRGKPGATELGRALALYEATRKPHTTRVLTTVRSQVAAATQRLRTGAVETDDELRARMRSRASLAWLHEHDVEGAFAGAVRALEGEEEKKKKEEVGEGAAAARL